METNKEQYFADLRKLKEDYADKNLRWFTQWKWPPRLFFFLTGTLIIFGSVSLPYLVHAPSEWKDPAVTYVSLGVAFLTSLNAFYAWQQTWQKRVRVTIALEHLLASWEIDILNASRAEHPKAMEEAYAATSRLFTQVHQIISGETQQLSAQFKPPQVTIPGTSK